MKYPFPAFATENQIGELYKEPRVLEVNGKTVYAPYFWSENALRIVASRYFAENENSVRDMIAGRIIPEFRKWGEYLFETKADLDAWINSLHYALVTQMFAFNSPVWFNVGTTDRPQTSACFINEVDDTMESIMELATTEAMIFRRGSGAGVNLSSLRSSKEKITGGGYASGPVSFMRGYDAFANIIKSGGKLRRAAKMQILNVSHPDIFEFINCKWKEEEKARVLAAAGYSCGMDGEAQRSVFFQNCNMSIRVPDEFMKRVVDGEQWELRDRHGKVIETVPAREIFMSGCEAAWRCGDPGMQFDTIINRMNPVPHLGRIVASNPCSEFKFINNTSCNLGSINLLKFDFRDLDSIDDFEQTVFTAAIAMDVMIDNSSFPTPKIEEMTRATRPLGIGYANLGAAIMREGWAYDSEDARNFCAAVTSLMSAMAWESSALLSKSIGPYKHFDTANHCTVMERHRDASKRLVKKLDEEYGEYDDMLFLARRADNRWKDAIALAKQHGLRNGQMTVLAPTGTIAFMMDCETTGIEPAFGLRVTKQLAHGGSVNLTLPVVGESLTTMGYEDYQVDEIVKHIADMGSLKDAPYIYNTDLPVFQTAVGDDPIRPEAHVLMMAAAQPFLSGAISKTCNLPEEATIEDIANIYMLAWNVGLKSIAVYRDGSKSTQPLIVKKVDDMQHLNKIVADAEWHDSDDAEWHDSDDDYDPAPGGKEPIIEGVREFCAGLQYGIPPIVLNHTKVGSDSAVKVDWTLSHRDGTTQTRTATVIDGVAEFDGVTVQYRDGELWFVDEPELEAEPVTEQEKLGLISEYGVKLWGDAFEGLHVKLPHCELAWGNLCPEIPQGKWKDMTAVETQQVHSSSHPVRKRLDDTRNSVTHKFSIAGTEGYITVGMYGDGRPGEVFVRVAKEGSTLSGLLDAFATMFSFALQYGIPLDQIVTKLKGTKFEPSGVTSNPEIRIASSIIDYVVRFVELVDRRSREIVVEDARADEMAVDDVEDDGTPKQFGEGGLPDYSDPWGSEMGHTTLRTIDGKVLHVRPSTPQDFYDAWAREGYPLDSDSADALNPKPLTTGNLCPECGGSVVQTGSCKACSGCGWSGGCG